MSKFDIEKFPTSEAAKRMLRRVSPVYENSYFYKWLCQTMGEEWDEARNIVASLREQAFTQTVTWGIEMQEHKYSITPDETLSLEERRARLFRKKTKKHPANPWFYENYIRNGWDIESDVDEVALGWGRLLLTILEDDGNHLHAMLKDLREKKQSHLVLQAVWQLIFGDDGDELQEAIDANDRQEGDFLANVGLAYHDTIPYGTNIPILSRDGKLRHGGKACRNGRHARGGRRLRHDGMPGIWVPFHHGWDDLSTDSLAWAPVWHGEEIIVPPREGGMDSLAMSIAIPDKAGEITGEIEASLLMGFHELVPYGTEKPVLSRDGRITHGGAARRDGRYARAGTVQHGTGTACLRQRGGKSDLETGRMAFFMGWTAEETVEAKEEGKMSLSVSLPETDVPKPEEEPAEMEIVRFLRRNGTVRHGGRRSACTYARAPLRQTFSMDGGFKLHRECRDGRLARSGGGIHRQDPIDWPSRQQTIRR